MTSTALTHAQTPRHDTSSTSADVATDHGLRLAPIDRPGSWLVRLFNWFMRLRFGKVMMPSRVIYARWPKLLWRQAPLYQLVSSGLSLDQDLRHLIEVQVSTFNQCTFCADLHRADATLMKVTQQKMAAIDSFETHAIFSERERAALRYVTEITRDHHTTDATFATLRSQFSETEIIEITWLQAFTTYLNRMAVPLGIGSDGFCEILAKR